MSETLSFPGLGLSFDINRVAFTLFGQQIYWYGVIIAAAFVLGAGYAMMRSKTFGLDSDRVTDVILGSVLLGIVGARLYYVAFSWDTYKDDLLSILFIREGGIAIYGGVIGGVLAALLVCKWRKVKLLPMLDLAAGGLILGQAVGRWGNFVNMEAFGSNTTAKWGMTSKTIAYYLSQHVDELAKINVTVKPDQPVHPTFFYESMWCLLGFLLILFFTRRRRFDGEIALFYLCWYSMGRFFIEGLRTDSLMLGTLRISQIVALLCVVGGLIVLIMTLSKVERSNDPDFMPLYVNTEESKLALAEKDKKGKASENAESAETEDAAEDEESAETEETAEDEETAEIEDATGDGETAETEDAAEDEETAETEEPAEAAEVAATEIQEEKELADGENH